MKVNGRRNTAAARVVVATRDRLDIGRDVTPQELDGDAMHRVDVLALEDLAHATGSDLAGEPVANAEQGHVRLEQARPIVRAEDLLEQPPRVGQVAIRGASV